MNKFVGRKFSVEDFDAFDYIFVMDHSNLHNVKSLARNQNDLDKVDLILNQISPTGNQDVPDPYYGGEEGFEQVYRLLDASTQIIAEKIDNGTL